MPSLRDQRLATGCNAATKSVVAPRKHKDILTQSMEVFVIVVCGCWTTRTAAKNLGARERKSNDV